MIREKWSIRSINTFLAECRTFNARGLKCARFLLWLSSSFFFSLSISLSISVSHTLGLTYRAGTPRAHQSGQGVSSQDAGEHPRSASVPMHRIHHNCSSLSLPRASEMRYSRLYNKRCSLNEICHQRIEPEDEWDRKIWSRAEIARRGGMVFRFSGLLNELLDRLEK